MGRTLIIAEKPAQAREYARTLSVLGKRDGYLENEKYVITWCFGHLLELERPEVYMDLERVGRRWSLKRLPVLPGLQEFRRAVKSDARKQYNVIQQWLKSKDIEQVICGTDADREGQLLFQEVWDSRSLSETTVTLVGFFIDHRGDPGRPVFGSEKVSKVLFRGLPFPPKKGLVLPGICRKNRHDNPINL